MVKFCIREVYTEVKFAEVKFELDGNEQVVIAKLEPTVKGEIDVEHIKDWKDVGNAIGEMLQEALLGNQEAILTVRNNR